jgi:hypothetical protein
LGTLNLEFSRHLIAPETATTTYDDGWFGYGKFVPPALPKKSTLKGSAVAISLNGLDEDESAPHFSSRSATPGSGGAAKPTRRRRVCVDRHSRGRSRPANPAPRRLAPPTRALRPAAPATHRRTTPTGPPCAAARPRRRKTRRTRPASPPPKAALNDDPNRPSLHRGKPAGTFTDTDIPKLRGFPGDQDLHQMAAVSDAADRPPHDFSRTWEGDDERQAILAKMEAAARTLLTAYEAANAVAPATPPPPPDTRQPNSKLRRATAKETPPAAAGAIAG